MSQWWQWKTKQKFVVPLTSQVSRCGISSSPQSGRRQMKRRDSRNALLRVYVSCCFIRADRAKLFWKVSNALSRSESLLAIGFCIAVVVGVLVYTEGNIPIWYLDSYISKVNNVPNLTGIFINIYSIYTFNLAIFFQKYFAVLYLLSFIDRES